MAILQRVSESSSFGALPVASQISAISTFLDSRFLATVFSVMAFSDFMSGVIPHLIYKIIQSQPNFVKKFFKLNSYIDITKSYKRNLRPLYHKFTQKSSKNFGGASFSFRK